MPIHHMGVVICGMWLVEIDSFYMVLKIMFVAIFLSTEFGTQLIIKKIQN